MLKKETFGTTQKGETITLYTFENQRGMKMTVSDLGAVLTHLYVPNPQGELVDVVLGFDQVQQYEKNDNVYFGSTIGRSANRIEGATFKIDETTYTIDQNEGENNLHGGFNGYQLRKWDVKAIDETKNQITFVLTSPDLDQGFPGELQMEATYQLSEDNCLSVTYQGKTNQKTIFNPTNHSYFNLNGHDQGKVTRHVLQLNASQYTPVKDSKSIPTGELKAVANTPMDFTQPKEIGQEIEADFEQLIYTKGYDHNYVIDQTDAPLTPFATVTGNQSGIQMTVATNLPGVQFYAGNFIEQELGKNNVVYTPRSGFCLEPQYFPNAINEANFEQPLLDVGEVGVCAIQYGFGLV